MTTHRPHPPAVRAALLTFTFIFLGALLLLPLTAVLAEAFRRGPGAYLQAIASQEARSAILLTLMATAVSVPASVAFGVAAAWAVTRFRFPGKSLLVTLIDLPFAVSPVVAGLALVMVYGTQGWLGPLLMQNGIRIIFATSGIILATIFVSFPFVARELIPLMQEQGEEEEQAALLLGASGWQIFWRITLPKIRWGVLYGVILCIARSMGEFGAVSVVSGHIRGKTNTVPLHVEILYNEYNFVGAFAVASLLVLLSVGTLAAKSALEWKLRRDASLAQDVSP